MSWIESSQAKGIWQDREDNVRLGEDGDERRLENDFLRLTELVTAELSTTYNNVSSPSTTYTNVPAP